MEYSIAFKEEETFVKIIVAKPESINLNISLTELKMLSAATRLSRLYGYNRLHDKLVEAERAYCLAVSNINNKE